MFMMYSTQTLFAKKETTMFYVCPPPCSVRKQCGVKTWDIEKLLFKIFAHTYDV